MSSCSWTIGQGTTAGALAPGQYTFRLSAYKESTYEMVNSSIAVLVEEGILPSVSIAPLPEMKQNANRKLSVAGSATVVSSSDTASVTTNSGATATITGGTSLGVIDQYEWTIDDPAVNLAAISLTGIDGRNLVLRPATLNAGTTYTLTLTAWTGGRSAFSKLVVEMNRAPYGGSVTSVFEGDVARALETDVTLNAVQWFDDDPADYPLSYSFGYRERGSSSLTALGKRSFAASAQMLKPPEGNFTIICLVYDSFLAYSEATTELGVRAAPPLLIRPPRST